jgi:hypothetical protein
MVLFWIWVMGYKFEHQQETVCCFTPEINRSWVLKIQVDIPSINDTVILHNLVRWTPVRVLNLIIIANLS